jgi:hypothetical protein
MEGLDWWLNSSPFNGMSGAPSGPPEWSRRGGIMRQPNRLVQMVGFFRSAYPKLQTIRQEREAEKAFKAK